MSTNPPAPQIVLDRHAFLMRLFYQAFETAVPKAKAYFDAENKPVNRWLFPGLVRYEVKEFLAKHGHTAEEEEEKFASDDIPNNGLSLQAGEDQFRILKADQDGGVPAPGKSEKRLEYFNFNQQLQLAIGNGASAGQSRHHLVVTWDVNENYAFTGLRLAYPLAGTPSSVELLWNIDVPHPALTITPETPSTSEVAEDLPIQPKLDEEEKETGTEGPA